MSVPHSPILTDFYQLTMMQGYYRLGMHKREAAFDLFFRENPFQGGYTIAAGLEEALKFLSSICFKKDDIEYLKTQNIFKQDFLEYLATLKFTGTVYAVDEGSLVFPLEPILRVQGPLDECQLVEAALLNIINFQSLIATKALRVVLEAGNDNVIEFGIRRAQGIDGGLSASRAAYIGGCFATSNVEAGKIYGIPVRGTHAHSWVMAFDSEEESFRAFADTYPKNTILLVDTYDTLKSGIPNAIRVGLEMKQRGDKIICVRLDSGDLAYLSNQARIMLDKANLQEVKILASGDLDEYIIHDLKAQGAKIDMFGVGTRMVTGWGEPALTGIYKMCAIKNKAKRWNMKLKITEGGAKATLPGLKQVWRFKNGNNEMIADWIELENRGVDFSKGVWGYHPMLKYEKKFYDNIHSAEPMLRCVLKDGEPVYDFPSLRDLRKKVLSNIKMLHPTSRRILNPHIYKVSIGPAIKQATDLLRKHNVLSTK